MIDFIVPKDPRLFWTMLCPRFLRWKEPSPLSGVPSYYIFWARNAIYHGLKALKVSPGDNILVPSFLCATAVEPIFRYGAKVKFYNIRRDCSPDFADIQRKTDKKTRAVLAVHYFGFPGPMRRFQELCKDYHLYLIEDCAHVLAGEAEGRALGTFGDISIFSWRKFLPVYDGGQLVINNPKLHVDIPWQKNGLLFSLKVAKNIFDKLIDDSSAKAVKTISHLLRYPYSTARRLLATGERQPWAVTINNYNMDFDLSSVNLRMSGFSRYIARNLDIPAIVKKRRQNSSYLHKAVEALPGVSPFFSELPEGVSPWAFPVLADGRQDFHVDLRSRGIPAFTWGECIHRELPIEEFPDAAFLYKNLVLLPIHQSLGELEMRTVIEAMAEVLRREH